MLTVPQQATRKLPPYDSVRAVKVPRGYWQEVQEPRGMMLHWHQNNGVPMSTVCIAGSSRVCKHTAELYDSFSGTSSARRRYSPLSVQQTSRKIDCTLSSTLRHSLISSNKLPGVSVGDECGRSGVEGPVKWNGCSGQRWKLWRTTTEAPLRMYVAI